MNLYQFNKIFSQMENEFGKAKVVESPNYAMLLFPIEGNALKVHRAFPASNSIRMKEAIALALYDIRDRYTGEQTDTSQFRNEDNERLEKAILMAFDPYTNDEIREIMEQKYQIKDFSKEMLKDYFKVYCLCLLRIKDSIDLWVKNMGSNGYFNFIEDSMGDQVQGNDMHFSIGM